MRETLIPEWLIRRDHQPFRPFPTFADGALLFGCGTELFTKRDCGLCCVGVDGPKRDRLLALLAVSANGRLTRKTAVQLDAAIADWQRGHRALASIRLAFSPLPRLSGLDEAHRLFLAEKALGAGMSPQDLLTELGYHDAGALLSKDWRSQPRWPAGSGDRSGEFAPVGAGIVPVFLDTTRQHQLETQQRRELGQVEPYSDSIPDGHALDLLQDPGAPLPSPDPTPDPPEKTEEDRGGRTGREGPTTMPTSENGLLPGS